MVDQAFLRSAFGLLARVDLTDPSVPGGTLLRRQADGEEVPIRERPSSF